VQDSQNLGDDKKLKKQSITATTIFTAAVEAVVGYIVVWFFEPIWKKIVKWWKGKNESNR